MAGGLMGRVIDLANFQAAPISLQGLNENNLVMLQVGPGCPPCCQFQRMPLGACGLLMVRSCRAALIGLGTSLRPAPLQSQLSATILQHIRSQLFL